ncbi:hypothetical protein F66182_6285 [Fusarium sp. NRRL 66182]|nr:hypothetical protein F66182_6285 [Fusarium sp. NRRL 66182]
MSSHKPTEHRDLLGLPHEIMDLILDEVALLPEPCKALFRLAASCKTLAAQTIPRLYYQDVVDSPEIPIALQWACWFGVLEAAEASLEALTRTGTDVASKIRQPFDNSDLYNLRYRQIKRIYPSSPSYGNVNWGNRSGLLHLACLLGRKPVVKLLIDNGFHPDTPDGNGLPALACALNEGIAKLLIQHGANINATDSNDVTALCHIISWAPSTMCSWKRGASITRGSATLQPLHAFREPFSTIRFLIQDAKADIYAEKIKISNPLQVAVSRRFTEVVELLLAAGASPNPISSDTGQKRLLLKDALEAGRNLPVIRLLLNAGAEADLDQLLEQGLTKEEGSALPIMNLAASDSNPLHAREEVEAAEMVCERIKHFDTPIDGHTALWHYVRKGRGDIGRVLIQHGADLEAANVEVRDTGLGLIGN